MNLKFFGITETNHMCRYTVPEIDNNLINKFKLIEVIEWAEPLFFWTNL